MKAGITGTLTVCLIALALTVQSMAGERQEAQNELSGKQVAFLVGEGFHDAETYVPMAYLANRGAEVTVIGVSPSAHKAYNSDITIHVQKSIGEISVQDFDALVIPGGKSPDWLRQHEPVVDFAAAFYESGKPVAAICHGPQVLIAADVVDGVTATCYASVGEELKEAGAEYVDKPVQRDGNLITSRNPDDIPAFSKAIAAALRE